MNVAGTVIAFMLVVQLGSCALIRPPQYTLDKKTTERITQLRKDMLLRRARALVQYEPIYQELETLLPQDNGAADDIRHYKSERKVIAEGLYDCGKESMLEKNYVHAEECLELSNKLVSYGDKQALLEKARSIRKQQEDKRRSEQIMSAYQQAYATGNLSEALLQLDMLIALSAENNQALALRDKLDAEIKLR
ncbi:MAG TPA: hypothetical protein VFY78_10155, partial [Gammaproteobacteria bacterium]|nr:hypothetical protein [Gammaproteobacteria bacterium]